jgi:hypothetical protein
VFWKPLTALPLIGAAAERSTWDLKSEVNPGNSYELAKDVSAFANHLGGVLLYGAKETNGRIGSYHPVPESVANDLEREISNACKSRCEPVPTYEIERHPKDSGWVASVSVSPFLGGLIGVRVTADKAKEGYGGNSFVFPIRSGNQTHYLTPTNMATYLDPAVRRAAILLSRIPEHTTVSTRTWNNNDGVDQDSLSFGEVDIERNRIRFYPVGGSASFFKPLDQVQTVYEAEDGWRITFAKHWR